MNIVEKVLERRMLLMVKVDEIQFGFMPGKGTINATRGVHGQGEKVVFALC